ncbi:TetR/AcrR family transcriptional regulator [Oceanobacillus sojae]|uniref:TetR family transcriptional regulator n=1 Tax=Oceanobacillus sojae TaxID=582851 RepID=A0A511ZJG2_9BACI|nr:TetR/AcrR family transcriptional regulator [Oceanobacillus sojae]GEN87582.1 TetR family transcriptional regulator [Oceanobacillus sojae]
MNISKLDEERKIAILNSALKEFCIRGYDNASTNVIAKEAGISKALMFHYVNNKQDLFLYVYDYFTQLLEKEYYSKLDFSDKDIFNRLRQSYLLQIDLLKQYPWIINVDKLTNEVSSDEINKALSKRNDNNRSSYEHKIFNKIDNSMFRPKLNIEICKQFILWSNIGFTSQILDNIGNSEIVDYEEIIATLDGYFDELRKVFYQSEEIRNG